LLVQAFPTLPECFLYIIDRSVKVDVDKYYKGDGKDTECRVQLEQYLRNRSWWKGEEDCFVAQVVKAGIKWLESQIAQGRTDRLFLWLDCFDPHEPWDPPSPYNRMYDPDYQGKDIIHPIPREVKGYLSEEEVKHIRALYAGEVTLVDKWVGIFLDEVRKLGILDSTLLIFVSDYGEPLGEGGWGHGIIRKARPWPYEELTHIPFILRHPDGVGKGKRVKGFVHTCDVMPEKTVLFKEKVVSPSPTRSSRAASK